MEHYIIVYDIVNDKKRNKIFELLKAYATHVQNSVFEGIIDDCDLLILEDKISRIIDKTQDSLIIYNQCSRCCEKARRYGVNSVVYGEDDIII